VAVHGWLRRRWKPSATPPPLLSLPTPLPNPRPRCASAQNQFPRGATSAPATRSAVAVGARAQSREAAPAFARRAALPDLPVLAPDVTYVHGGAGEGGPGGGGRDARTRIHTARGWNVRAGRTSRIWSTDRFRTTPSRPDRPLAPSAPASPSPHSRVQESFPFCRPCMCMHSQNSPRTLARTAGGLVAICSPPSPPFSRDSTLPPSSPPSLSLSISSLPVAIDILSSRLSGYPRVH